MINSGADASIKNQEGNTPLHIAARKGDVKLIEMLLPHQTESDLPNNEGSTTLLLAFSSGNIEAIKLFIKSEEVLKVKDYIGNSIYHYAAHKGNAPLLHRMFKETSLSDWKKKNDLGATPLHYAAGWGDAETLIALINYGLDVHARDNDGNTALHYAAKNGNVETCQFLMNLMDPEPLFDTNNNGAAPIHYVMGKVPNHILKEFLDLGMPLDKQDFDGNTPLFYAINSRMSFDNANMLFLLEHGADSRHYNLSGLAPIHIAGQMKSVKKVQRLLTYSDDLELIDQEGNTILHIAVIANDKSLVEFLLTHLSEAAISQKNNAGFSALDLAKEPEIRSLIQTKN